MRTKELADILVQGISEGIPLRELCRQQQVGKSAIYKWIEEDADLRGRIARARLEGYDAIADECMDIADDSRNDWMERRSQDGQKQLDAEHVQRSKLRIETRLKLLAKWDPKRYGEKVDLNHAGNLTVVVRKLSEG